MIDQRNRLQEEPFEYKVTKSGKVFIYWNNKEIKVLSGKVADKFLRKIENKSDFDVQLELAKFTGHFKHGNERQ